MQIVQLRNLQSDDEIELARLLNNKHIWNQVRDYLPYPYTCTDARLFIAEQAKLQTDTIVKAIDVNGNFAGCISISEKNDVYRLNGELGFWIGEPFWQKGIATQAVKQILKIGFIEKNLHRIYASVFSFNVASAKVLEKCGLRKEAVLKEAVIKNEQIIDEYIYAILKTEYYYDKSIVV